MATTVVRGFGPHIRFKGNGNAGTVKLLTDKSIVAVPLKSDSDVKFKPAA